MAFPAATLGILARTSVVDVETTSPKGRVHRVPIWVVVDGDEVFVRSYRGAGARWYREILARPGALVAGPTRIGVRAVQATDARSKRRTTLGFKAKYRPGSSRDAMVRPEVLDTTLRLEPA
jgi:hypothetical protein